MFKYLGIHVSDNNESTSKISAVLTNMEVKPCAWSTPSSYWVYKYNLRKKFSPSCFKFPELFPSLSLNDCRSIDSLISLFGTIPIHNFLGPPFRHPLRLAAWPVLISTHMFRIYFTQMLQTPVPTSCLLTRDHLGLTLK